MKSRLPTSTQPQPARTRIYGSSPVKPLASSNQPQVLPHTRVHGSKLTQQIRVKMKGGSNKDAFLIRKQDFDEVKHEKVEA